jgi:hypothetical protein
MPAPFVDKSRGQVGKRRVSFFRDSAAFTSNASPFVGRHQYTIDGQSKRSADLMF